MGKDFFSKLRLSGQDFGIDPFFFDPQLERMDIGIQATPQTVGNILLDLLFYNQEG